jgi:hypothetical protein
VGAAAQVLEPEPDRAAGGAVFAAGDQAHGEARGVPAAADQPAKNRSACGSLIEVKRLWVERPRKGDDLFLAHANATARFENLADGKIVEISFRHHLDRSRFYGAASISAASAAARGKIAQNRLSFSDLLRLSSRSRAHPV